MEKVQKNVLDFGCGPCPQSVWEARRRNCAAATIEFFQSIAVLQKLHRSKFDSLLRLEEAEFRQELDRLKAKSEPFNPELLIDGYDYGYDWGQKSPPSLDISMIDGVSKFVGYNDYSKFQAYLKTGVQYDLILALSPLYRCHEEIFNQLLTDHLKVGGHLAVRTELSLDDSRAGFVESRIQAMQKMRIISFDSTRLFQYKGGLGYEASYENMMRGLNPDRTYVWQKVAEAA